MAVITPYFSHSDVGITNNTAVRYFPLGFGGDDGENFSTSDENRAVTLISETATIGGFIVKLTVAPGVGRSWTFTIRKNRTNTALSVTISGTDTTAANWADRVIFSAGDELSVESSPSGTPLLTQDFHSQILMSSSNYIIMGGTGDLTNGQWDGGLVARHPNLQGIVGDGPFGGTTEGNVCPVGGTLKNFYLKIGTAPGSGNTRTFTLRLNGSVQFTFSLTDSTTTANDTATLVTVAAGDLLLYRTTGQQAGTEATFAAWACSFTSDSPLLGAPFFHGDTSPNTSSDTFYPLYGSGESASESEVLNTAFGSVQLSNLYVKFETAPGSGNTFTTTVYTQSSPTALSVAVNGGSDTSGNNTTNTVTANQDDSISVNLSPDSSPASSAYYSFSLLMKWTGRAFPGFTDAFFDFYEQHGGNDLKLCHS